MVTTASAAARVAATGEGDCAPELVALGQDGVAQACDKLSHVPVARDGGGKLVELRRQPGYGLFVRVEIGIDPGEQVAALPGFRTLDRDEDAADLVAHQLRMARRTQGLGVDGRDPGGDGDEGEQQDGPGGERRPDLTAPGLAADATAPQDGCAFRHWCAGLVRGRGRGNRRARVAAWAQEKLRDAPGAPYGRGTFLSVREQYPEDSAI